jgi:carbon storage regulator
MTTTIDTGHLCLTRRVGESISIGSEIVVRVESVDGCEVQIGVFAPKDVKVLRRELVEQEEACGGK